MFLLYYKTFTKINYPGLLQAQTLTECSVFSESDK